MLDAFLLSERDHLRNFICVFSRGVDAIFVILFIGFVRSLLLAASLNSWDDGMFVEARFGYHRTAQVG